MQVKILSIIVPSYNMEAYLPKCLRGLVIDDKELLGKLDVIVVNDGSKDRTSEIAHSFETKYPGVFRVIDKTNGHYGSCINAALPVAEGEYVKILDADDSVDTQGFKRLLEIICEELGKGDEAADLVATDYASVNPDGEILFTSKFGLDEGMTSLEEQKDGGARLTIHAICYRTRNLRRMGYRQSEGMPYTDTEWIIEPMITVKRIRYVPLTVTFYLIGRDGQTMDPKVLSRSFQSILTITRGIVSRYQEYNLMCEQSSLGYYKKQIVMMLRFCYEWGLLGYDGHKMTGDLRGFDDNIKSYSMFYQAAGEFKTGPVHFPFWYVEFWRRHGFGMLWFWRCAINDFLLWLAKVIRKSK